MRPFTLSPDDSVLFSRGAFVCALRLWRLKRELPSDRRLADLVLAWEKDRVAIGTALAAEFPTVAELEDEPPPDERQPTIDMCGWGSGEDEESEAA